MKTLLLVGIAIMCGLFTAAMSGAYGYKGVFIGCTVSFVAGFVISLLGLL